MNRTNQGAHDHFITHLDRQRRRTILKMTHKCKLVNINISTNSFYFDEINTSNYVCQDRDGAATAVGDSKEATGTGRRTASSSRSAWSQGKAAESWGKPIETVGHIA